MKLSSDITNLSSDITKCNSLYENVFSAAHIANQALPTLPTKRTARGRGKTMGEGSGGNREIERGGGNKMFRDGDFFENDRISSIK